MKDYDLLIAGAGPAGCTAAIYGARAGLDTLLLEKRFPGGQMALTEQIDNFPGLGMGIGGFELSMQMKKDADRAGAVFQMAEVTGLQADGDFWRLETPKGPIRGRSVILATGAKARTLGLPNEERFLGRGVHYCAVCDGAFYRGKTVALVGGGNSALEEAAFLARLAKRVVLIHRRGAFRGSQAQAAAVEALPNVELRMNSQVAALLGDERFQGIVVSDTQQGGQEELPCDGLFVSIGRTPDTGFLQGWDFLDDQGYIMPERCPKGIFAAGDVRSGALRQIVSAAADGAQAAVHAEQYLGRLR